LSAKRVIRLRLTTGQQDDTAELQRYRDARIDREAHEVIAQHNLAGWSADDQPANRPLADAIARRLEVPVSGLPAFLQGSGFDSMRRYCPDRHRREAWFTGDLTVI